MNEEGMRGRGSIDKVVVGKKIRRRNACLSIVQCRVSHYRQYIHLIGLYRNLDVILNHYYCSWWISFTIHSWSIVILRWLKLVVLFKRLSLLHPESRLFLSQTEMEYLSPAQVFTFALFYQSYKRLCINNFCY